jgi:hypothetical protein
MSASAEPHLLPMQTRWDDAVRVADTCRHPQSNELRRAHHQWLLASGQDGKAGALQEKAGDLLGAIGLYLKAGLPARAAQVRWRMGRCWCKACARRAGCNTVMSHDSCSLRAADVQVIISHRGSYNAALLESIAAALSKAGLHERCGDLHEHLGRPQEALQAFRQARAYRCGGMCPHQAAPWHVRSRHMCARARARAHATTRPNRDRKAVKLARGVSPAAVIVLEEEWGDWLAGQRQLDAAVNHFIEAGATVKAIEAALADRQCAKAAGIVDFLEPRVAAPYFRRIAVLYEDAGNRCGRSAGDRGGAGCSATGSSWGALHGLRACVMSHGCTVGCVRGWSCAHREQAERYHLAAGATMDAVDMWMRAGARACPDARSSRCASGALTCMPWTAAPDTPTRAHRQATGRPHTAWRAATCRRRSCSSSTPSARPPARPPASLRMQKRPTWPQARWTRPWPCTRPTACGCRC